MDSRFETSKHIFTIQKYILKLVESLQKRLINHDKSKLESPEVEIFDKVTDKLNGLTYGSEEYKKALEEINQALIHHYQNNRHHSEHFKRGIIDMNLVDMCEMLCDWKAASLRHADGNIRKSIEINQQRFGYSDELKQILINTVEMLEME